MSTTDPMTDYVTATMATTPERIDHARGVVVDLAHQVDRIIVYVNGQRPADFDVPPGAEFVWAPDGDLADNGMFFHIPEYGWHLTVDDDLHYPADYVAQIVAGAERYGRGAVVSFHGSRVHRAPIRSYYRDREKYHCLGAVPKDIPVHVPGTGVMAYRAGRVRLSASVMPVPYMADIWTAIACQQQRVPVVVLAHKGGWIRHRDIDHALTIYERFKDNDRVQTWAVNRQSWALYSFA